MMPIERLAKHRSLTVPLLLLLSGAIYYSQYYDHGFNYGDEGSVVLLAQRLLEGETPFIDLNLGYGILWFYPLVLLFKVVGVNFIAAKLYFFSIALATALLAYVTLLQRTRLVALAATVSALLILVPGSIHKVYVPLIVVASIFVLTRLDLGQQTLKPVDLAIATAVVTICYHLRADLSIIPAALLVGIVLLHTFSNTRPLRQAQLVTARLLGIMALTSLALSVPLFLHAYSRGFGAQLARGTLMEVLRLPKIREALFSGVYSEAGTASTAPDAGLLMMRIPFSALWEGGADRSLALLTYLPLIVMFSFLIFCTIAIRRRLSVGLPLITNEIVGPVIFAATAMAPFPHFFIFRPDVAHLSQFMPGYIVFASLLVAILYRCSREESWTWRGRLVAAAIAILVLHVGYYSWFGLNHASVGSIGVRGGVVERFEGANGVDVQVKPRRHELLREVATFVESYSDEGDYLLCFPFAPGFNVMTGRPTFAQRLYVDDAVPVLEPGWQDRMIEQIAERRPALIIIEDKEINRTQISNFRNWATGLQAFIDQTYTLLKTVRRLTFYVRSDLVRGDASP